jgi:hypothetical protein
VILFIVCAAAIIAVIVTLILLVRSDRWDGSRDYEYAGQHRTAEPLGQPADEDTIAWMQRLAAEQRGSAHEEYLPAAPAAAVPADEFMAVPLAGAPVSPRRVPGRVLRPGRARATDRVLPPMLAPAFGVAATFAAMAQRVAANEHREAARLRNAVRALEAEIQRLHDEAEFPHLREGLFGDWVTGDFPAVIEAMDNEAVPA